jgi:hypothetical protein
MATTEKVAPHELETARTNLTDDPKAEAPPTFSALETKKLLRKIDYHLIPFLSLLYLLSFLE